jgi:predicted hydrolase (HD superfamily)
MIRDEAWKKLCEWTESASLRNHARTVEIAMRAAAHRYGRGAEDEDAFAIAGMLHDADYEKWPEEHPGRIVAWLAEQGEPAIAHAVSAHNTRWNVPYESALDRALVGCDELAGFIVACCLVRPDGIRSLTPDKVLKRLKQKGFAASVERDEVQKGAALLGVDLAEHVRFLIEALAPHAEELGIAGKP